MKYANIVDVKNVCAQIGDRRIKWHVIMNIVVGQKSVVVILVNVQKEHKIVYASVVIEEFEAD